jgi:phosphatidylglycerophosphate synthase
MKGRKIDRKYENPIDNVLIDICEFISPVMYKYKISPNMITTIGVFFNILSLYVYFQKKKYQAAFYWFMNYFCDCLDGYIARKYNMVTEFGDWYDHATDLIGYISLLFWLYYTTNSIIAIIPLIILSMLAMIQMNNQEKISNSVKSTTLSSMNTIIKYIPKIDIEYSRYVGAGTFHFVIILYILYL